MPPKNSETEAEADNTAGASTEPAAEAEPAAPEGAPAADAPAEPPADPPAAPQADPGPAPIAEPENPLADMGMAPMRSNNGATSCSFNGETYEADDTGLFIVPLEAAGALMSHGFSIAQAG